MTREDLERMYLVEHRTMQEIGDANGISKQRVCQLIHGFGIDVRRAERFTTKCDTCGVEFEITRKRYNKSVKHFCCMRCYTRFLNNFEYRQSRTGQRMARKFIEEHIGRELRPGEVIHHRDGNCMNNSLDNLILFSSHSEHMKHHHQVKRGLADVLPR